MRYVKHNPADNEPDCDMLRFSSMYSNNMRVSFCGKTGYYVGSDFWRCKKCDGKKLKCRKPSEKPREQYCVSTILLATKGVVRTRHPSRGFSLGISTEQKKLKCRRRK